jgi:hypothetical protein
LRKVYYPPTSRKKKVGRNRLERTGNYLAINSEFAKQKQKYK